MNAIKGDLSFDPYGVLGLSNDCTDVQIVKAFRKAALKWHPDKNPDRKKLSEEMFLKISQAFELLSDPAAKAAYDRLQAAKTAKAAYIQRRQQTCSAQKVRLLEELERREAEAAKNQDATKVAKRNLEKEIQRLREEGSRLLQKEREKLEKQIHENFKNFVEKPCCSTGVMEPARLKVKWKCADASARLSEEDILRLFEKYGKISMVVMSPSGKSNAIIEFKKEADAV
uniref:J domain-containing protein n=1 Tax=Syphacia muris TaxID=451379 RepID=A0A0N5AP66_9BILA